ncbi:MAG: hypothetical protein KDK70_42920, partial [Myxococcales bacterium]|nr:hypothetical protein [Myxococcales bacterium]
MASTPKRADESGTGRLVVIGAAVLGLAGIVGYAITQAQQRERARATAQQVVVEPPSPQTVTIPTLVSQAHEARRALDTTALARVERELDEAAVHTTTVPKGLDARRERLAVLGTLATEASLRAAVLGDEQIRRRATDYATQGRALAKELDDALDPGEALAAEARLALASGGDVAITHPSVLLLTFRDRELRHVVLAQELLHPSDLEAAEVEGPRADLVAALEDLPDPTGLEQALLALALQSSGNAQRATSTVDAMLASVPDQPLALAL